MSCASSFWPRCGVVGMFAFMPPVPQYTAELEGLEWAPREKGLSPVPFVHVKTGNRDAPVMLFSHGNSEDLRNALVHARLFSRVFDVDVVAYDYDGYGLLRNSSHCSEEGCYLAIRAVYDCIVHTKLIDPRRVVLYGHSLGTGPTVDLAAQLSRDTRDIDPSPFAGVLLKSPLVSAMRVVSPLSIPAFDIFCNADKIAVIRQHIALIHGDNDCVIPHFHTHELAAIIPAHKRAVYIVEGAGHNDIEWFQDEWTSAVEAFFNRIGFNPRSSARSLGGRFVPRDD